MVKQIVDFTLKQIVLNIVEQPKDKQILILADIEHWCAKEREQLVRSSR